MHLAPHCRRSRRDRGSVRQGEDGQVGHKLGCDTKPAHRWELLQPACGQPTAKPCQGGVQQLGSCALTEQPLPTLSHGLLGELPPRLQPPTPLQLPTTGPPVLPMAKSAAQLCSSPASAPSSAAASRSLHHHLQQSTMRICGGKTRAHTTCSQLAFAKEGLAGLCRPHVPIPAPLKPAAAPEKRCQVGGIRRSADALLERQAEPLLLSVHLQAQTQAKQSRCAGPGWLVERGACSIQAGLKGLSSTERARERCETHTPRRGQSPMPDPRSTCATAFLAATHLHHLRPHRLPHCVVQVRVGHKGVAERRQPRAPCESVEEPAAGRRGGRDVGRDRRACRHSHL